MLLIRLTFALLFVSLSCFGQEDSKTLFNDSDNLDSLLQHKDDITKLLITYGKGEFMPIEVYEFKNLDTLMLMYCRYEFMPVGISKLSKLKYLNIYATTLKNLPWAIIKLRELKGMFIENLSEFDNFHISPFWKHLQVEDVRFFNKKISGWQNLSKNNYIKKLRLHEASSNFNFIHYLATMTELQMVEVSYSGSKGNIPKSKIESMKSLVFFVVISVTEEGESYEYRTRPIILPIQSFYNLL
jgi:hypothetical protein